MASRSGSPRCFPTSVSLRGPRSLVEDPVPLPDQGGHGSEKAPFAEAVFADPIYLDYSRYALQIEQYLEHFAREQLLVVTSEDLRELRDATMRRVYEFIGVDPAFVPANLDREFYQTKDRAIRSPVPLRLRKGLKRRFPSTRRFKELSPTYSARSGGSSGAASTDRQRRCRSPFRRMYERA